MSHPLVLTQLSLFQQPCNSHCMCHRLERKRKQQRVFILSRTCKNTQQPRRIYSFFFSEPSRQSSLFYSLV